MDEFSGVTGGTTTTQDVSRATDATDVAAIVKNIHANSGDAWSAPPAVAEAWLASRKTASGFTGSMDEFRISVCYHLAKYTCSEDVKKNTEVWTPDGANFLHSVLLDDLREFQLRQMAMAAFRKVLPKVAATDEIKTILEQRAAAAGLDSSNLLLAVDFLHPGDMTPAELALRGATKKIVIAERNRQKMEALKMAAAKAAVERVVEVEQRATTTDENWRG